MTENRGVELADMGPWDGLPDIDDRVTRVFCTGGRIQLLTECDATTQLLRETGAHQSGKLKGLFSHLATNDRSYDYDKAVTWMAFSYTCAYIAELMKAPGTADPEDAVFKARSDALAAVIANRGDVLMVLKNDPGALFAGADKPLKDLVKFEVLQGIASPAQRIFLGEGNNLNELLAAVPWQDIGDAEWQNLCGNHYRTMWYDLAGFGFYLGGQKIVEAEALLDPNLVQKAVQHCRIKLADGSRRKQAGCGFVQRITSVRFGLEGNKYEYDTAHMATNLAGDAHWQDKIADWRLGTGGNRKIYYSEVHPKIAQYMLSILPFTPTPDQVTVLDIAGGNGDLGERIISELASQLFIEMRLNYILVDYSKADVAIATRRFKNLKLPKGFRVEAIALTKDMLAYQYNAQAALHDFGIPGGADIVINSGGLLNNQIGNDLQTPVKFNRMYAQLLKPGGFGIYSGLTPLLVDAATHRAENLRIINLHDPEVDRQMHVVQRPK